MNVLNPSDVVARVQARIEAANQYKPVGAYIARGGFGIESVHCKCCGQALRALTPHEDFQEERIVNGRPVIVQRLVLGTLPPYTEVRIEFDDGSRHITPTCDECHRGLTAQDLEWLYCCDLAEWLFDGAHADPMFWEAMLARKPVSCLAFPPGIVAS